MSGAANGCLPTPGQMLLLNAALGEGTGAIAAWEKWDREYGLDRPDEGSYRLLPLVYRNLSAQGYAGTRLNTLKGLHRHSWSKNQVFFGQVRPLLEELRASGTPMLLLKGAALASSVYPDTGCRPMRDIDILVPVSHARALCRKLEATGWRPLYWRPRSLRESFFRFRHAIDYENPTGGRVDVHWHALNLCCHPAFDEVFWKHAEPIEFLGAPMQTCHATEHLLEICAHGIVWSPVPPVRWIADAVLLLRSSSGVDWERLTRTARAFDVVPYVHRALAVLRSVVSAPVPLEVIGELERAPAGTVTEAEFARHCDPFASRTAWQDLLTFYAPWRRSLVGSSPLLHSAGFARHLQFAFELEHAWELPAQLARSAFRRFAGRNA